MSALRALSREQRLVGLPVLGLVASQLLPWYRESAPRGGGDGLVTTASSALGAFGWVEAALLLVCTAVMTLLWLRAQRRGFHLPGGDGWAVTIAGGWAVVLLVWRMFDRPEVAGGSVGVEWGLVVALVMAAVLVASGQRLRAAHVAEPPNPAATGEHAVVPRVRPRPVADMPTRAAARRDLEDDAPTRTLPPDEDAAPTRALPPDEDAAPTRALPPDEDAAPTRALPPDEDAAPTRRLPPDIPPPPTSPPPPRD